ncbi:unnamed protein product [Paramecium primaurelia]|uniref:VWFA domain-containing protein n=1 Tax=Paramecium primaurelia TaxID=5886 RepID=A0A8S1MX55_PARPR|nr:unnamed protein product [Paramecium primaurelia]
MVKRSKSIERTIKEAEQYLSRFPDFTQKPKKQSQIKINQNVQQNQGLLSNSKSEKKEQKQKVKILASTQKTLNYFIQKKVNVQDDNIQTKVIDKVVSSQVQQDKQKQQEEIDVSQILMSDQNSKGIQQNDKNKEQQQDADKKVSQDWWKSIFYQGHKQEAKSIKNNTVTSFLKPNNKVQQVVIQKQEENIKIKKLQESINTPEKQQNTKTSLKLANFFQTKKLKMDSIINQSKQNEQLNQIQIKDNNINNNNIEGINKDFCTKVKENKEDIKLLSSSQNNNDRLNEKEYAKPQNNIQKEQKVIQSQSIMISQVPDCEFGMVDCVFVVDTTGSMDPYLERTTEAVEMIINKIKQQSLEEQVSVKFGLVCYRDHPPQELTYVTEVHDLCSRSEIISIIKQADCYGGGDGAEAALDGLNEAVKKISWRDSSTLPSLRYIFHICDQPPHGKEFGGYSELWDEGCPCGLKPEEVVNRINRNEIHYRLIMANGSMLQKFAQYLRGIIHNYDETTLDVAIGMEIRISDMVIRELCPYTQQE